MYTDFEKAFDTVSHSKLICKLQGLGICGKLLAWLKNYFVGREQAVKVGSGLSGWRDITSGVPQGSVLGPLLFILFIDDLVQEMPAAIKIKLYADDAKLYIIYEPHDWTPCLQLTLAILEKWTVKWELRLAVAKCSLFYLGRLNRRHAYTAFGVPLEAVSVVRDLGVLLSDDLKWLRHTAHIASKASQRANAIFKAFTFSSFDMLASAYITYVRPLLESASVVWSPYLLQEKRLLESASVNILSAYFAGVDCRPLHMKTG
ncbi:reverse transcriptase domain-containing protein [Pseudoalteromonas sp.]|uniref:reverse transcriptase domain-containing protein n=1 Tax=Pseudoalteromonas sp. TaxID=53249 RepID=UPI00261D307D|nr:reverse transcriptase domain-containing protein [Pseudoalteromonas sp.]MCP4585909.1 hypothetical protein [Pseudoalteromonas sp.]